MEVTMLTENTKLIRYDVQPYDTLESIAQCFNTGIHDIMAVNRGIDLDNLYSGQNIFVNLKNCRPNEHMLNTEEDIPQIALMKELRMLWEQHVVWTRLTIISMVENLADVDLVTKRLLQNPVDFAALLEMFYGKQIANKFKDLFTSHLVIASEIVSAAKEGDNQKAAEAEKRWYENADQIASFLSTINPFWSKDEWRKMLFEHLELTKTEAVDLITKKYADSITVFDEIESQALMMADMMQNGLVLQFPEKFT